MIDLLIPCYNEDKNVRQLVMQWGEIVKNNRDLSVYFIDNGSTDNTRKIIKNELQKINDENLKIIVLEENVGYGAGIKKGISMTSNTYISWTHADLQINSKDVNNLICKYISNKEKDNQLFMGKRKNRNLFDQFFTLMMSFFSFLFTGYYLKDINSQPKIFPRRIVTDHDTLPNDFNIDLAILLAARKNNLDIKLNNLIFHKRNFNKSKGGGSILGKLKLSISTLIFIISYSIRRFDFRK